MRWLEATIRFGATPSLAFMQVRCFVDVRVGSELMYLCEVDGKARGLELVSSGLRVDVRQVFRFMWRRSFKLTQGRFTELR